MRLCKNTIEFVQIINEDGDVRLCGWQRDGGIIGSISEGSLEKAYHSKKAELIRERHCKKDYSNCTVNACPYVSNNTVDENSVDIEQVPVLPSALYLAYENICNYHCVMCTIPDCRFNAEDHEKKLNKIDAEVRKVLPHLKHISANGLGELFVSRHIMQLLSEWRPFADPSECSASLETNGSLFNAENWEKISNLGQYHLSVAITVLSLKESVYHELSGTNLPLKNLIDNLHFVRSLREKNIINYLEIATVYQDKNFREIPEFARRAIEEFGADYVRLRPYEPWREATMEEWMRDVRNVYHPHHREFLEVMKDPYLKNPKIHDWGGGRESGLGPEPYPRMRRNYGFMKTIFCDGAFINRLSQRIRSRKIVVYGMDAPGKALVSRLRKYYRIPYCLDRAMEGKNFDDVPIHGINNLDELDKEVSIIVTTLQDKPVVDLLKKVGYKEVYTLRELQKG